MEKVPQLPSQESGGRRLSWKSGRNILARSIALWRGIIFCKRATSGVYGEFAKGSMTMATCAPILLSMEHDDGDVLDAE